jgi:acyl-coenzyme A thioesterase PaaI-like protein
MNDSADEHDKTGAFIRRSWDLVEDPTDPAWRAKRSLAKALRRLNNFTIGARAGAAELTEAAQRVEQALALIESQGSSSFKEDFDSGAYFESPEIYADRAWLTGNCNPISPLAKLEQDGQFARASVCFGNAYVGAPGWVHGGAVAAIFDQVMGFVLIMKGHPCVTAELAVKYHSPTPAHGDLKLRAHETKRVGSRVFIEATCHHGSILTATASATFVLLKASRFASYLSS